MLSRFLKRPSNLHLFKTLIIPNNTHSIPHSQNHNISLFTPQFPLQISHFKFFSSSNRNNNGKNKNNKNGNSNKNGGDGHDPKTWLLNGDDEEEDDIFSFDKEEPIEKSKRRNTVETVSPNKWKLDSNDNVEEDVFKFEDEKPIEGVKRREDGEERNGEAWKMDGGEVEVEDDPFAGFTSGGVDGVGGVAVGGEKDDRFKPWSGFGGDEEGEKEEEVFADIEEGIEPIGVESEVGIEAKEGLSEELKKEKKALEAKLKGKNRVFGDVIEESGITEAMVETLTSLQDLEHLGDLPALVEVEDKYRARKEIKAKRVQMEREKQEAINESRVRIVDEKGRSYATGRRKTSVARVWIQRGKGNIIVNDKHFDAYFPIIDHRASLLQPFNETKTLGLWDVKCTVKGGGTSGQVGAVRLGISRALQLWEPELRPYLKKAGLLSRDPRMVERKKPGKAKARKSFQWVKR